MESMNAPKKTVFVGLFFVTFATLMLEILLTRVFSVTMLYHFAFVAISIAMFGMTIGGLFVYLVPSCASPGNRRQTFWLSSLLFAAAVPLSFIVHNSTIHLAGSGFARLAVLALTYIVCLLPFIFSGIVVSCIIVCHSSGVGTLYAVDLFGAALGCLAIVATLQMLDAESAVYMTAAAAALGAIFFATEQDFIQQRKLSATLFIFFAAAALLSFPLKGFFAARFTPLSQKYNGQKQLFEKWNSFSRVIVFGDDKQEVFPFGWGFSRTIPNNCRVNQLWLTIDASAGTPLTHFSGDLKSIEFLKYDVTNVAHYLRSAADVLVVGSGGGRDILSGLAFGQRSVTGVELNPNVGTVLTKDFADFTGRLASYPQVRLINEEARSYLTRSAEKMDIIQVSLIDTWAATAAGGFTLSENTLYTTEAWKIFMDHLKPGGILTFSRWYYREQPTEMYRLVALAVATLKPYGIADLRNHVLIMRQMQPMNGADAPEGVGTVLVSREPFSPEDVAKFQDVARRMKFEIALAPGISLDPAFEKLLGQGSEGFIKDYPLNIFAPTDDRPYFFQTLHLTSAFDRRSESLTENQRFHVSAVSVLATLFITVTALTLLLIFFPLVFSAQRPRLKKSRLLIGYFLAIGVGFMLIEVSMMQKLTLFLGHPVYGLTVVLSCILLGGGLGSLATNRLHAERSRVRLLVLFVVLIAVLLAFLVFPFTLFVIYPIWQRMILAMAALLPTSFMMGMAFPTGMQAVGEEGTLLIPWLWGINGAASVFSSVLAVVLSMQYGISCGYAIGVVFYVLAACCLILRRARLSTSNS